jgi:4-amino-4-deoxy-L-arabinose transferase-like glycosyltransferase
VTLPVLFVVIPTDSVNSHRGEEAGSAGNNGSPAALPSLRRRLHPLFAIFSLAVLVRLISLAMVQPWPVTPDAPIWKSGPEIVNIATSIATHKGFSSPFAISTGPTAWIPPVYPYLVAAIFSIAGLRSNFAVFAILAMQAIFSALICFPIYGIGKRAFDEKTATWAAWAWALFPYAALIPVLFIWETTLSALWLTILCYLCLDLPASSLKRQMTIGALWGLAALTNTALLSLFPVFVLFPYLHGPSLRTSVRAIMTVGILFTLVVAPWFLRNWRSLRAVVPIRSNFGEELWQGNHDGGMGRIIFGLSPCQNEWERERYRRVGEIAYVAQRRKDSLAFISQNPGKFVEWVFYRFRYWWFAQGESGAVYLFYRLLTVLSVPGLVLAWRAGKIGARLLVVAIIVYPLVYYVTDIYPRYRHPVEPFMALLGTFTVVQLVEFIKAKSAKI